MYFIVAEKITNRLLIWGICMTAVCSRMPFDKTWSIGGDISKPFRKMLLCIIAVNFLRMIASMQYLALDSGGTSTSGGKMDVNLNVAMDTNRNGNSREQRMILSDMLGVVEVVGVTFLCMLTPYLLQQQLSAIINVGSEYKLMPWIFIVSIFSIGAMVLPNAWFLKKIGNALSGVPVILTMRLYDSVVCADSVHRGRGNILSQTLVMVEYWHIMTQLLCAIGYAFYNYDDNDVIIKNLPNPQMFSLLKAFKGIAFPSDWIRLFCHSIMLNRIDEISHYSSTTSSAQAAATDDYGGEDNNEDRMKTSNRRGTGGLDVSVQNSGYEMVALTKAT